MTRATIALALAVLLACAGSGGSGSGPEEAAPLRRVESQTIAVQATVKAVDLDKRLVTITDGAGSEATFYADEAVRNLPQVKPGDLLVGELSESVVLELREATPAEAAAGGSVLEVVAAAEPGQRPAGHFVRQITAVLTIEAIDRAAGTATLRGPAGNSHVVPARDPAHLDRVAVGDTVVATYTEALRLAVVAPGAR